MLDHSVTSANSTERVEASVLLPVFNGAAFLRPAITSILKQRFSAFELLILNDGSTDDSLNILEAFAKNDHRCRVFSWPNQGLVKTLNAGISLARGDIIIRMDADDICRSERFQKQLAFLDAHPECVAVGSGVLLIDDEGLPLLEMANYTTHDAIVAEFLGLRTGIWHPTAAIRRRALESIGGYSEDYPHSEDTDLFLRLAEVGKLANIDEVLLEYRQHLHSAGYRYPSIGRESKRRAVENSCLRRGIRPPPFPNFTDEPYSLAAVHRKWAWWALKAGNLPTARKHAIRALRREPMNLQNWRLSACVLRGY